ncbi:MAG: DUF2892 domain-containing protein [Eubacteriales bacterium]|jgi:hypothetical protein|nr:DUF2892 domain-containing protein [Eubacteriales bacterium]
MSVFPPTAKRVFLRTNSHVNKSIENRTNQNIRKYEGADSKTLTGRLKELDREWDTERILEVNASVLVFIGTALGFFVSRYWLIIPGAVSFYFLQHALQGWCPPLPIIRRMGIRTAAEISAEREIIQKRLKHTRETLL